MTLHSAQPYLPSLRARATAFAAVIAGGWLAMGDMQEVKAAASEPLVVVELFTSQGCASCPPADAFLSEIVQRKGVLALSQHVDYWNYMGWKDPFSSAMASKRQKAYASSLGQRYVYTPQMIVDGKAQDVGSNREAVEAMLADARRAIDKKLPLHVYPGAINQVKVTLPAAPPMTSKGGKDGADAKAQAATLWLVAYDSSHVTDVERGENRGKTLTYHNVVRTMRAVGEWQGKPMTLMLNLADEIAAGYGNAAVILQAGKAGPILAAATLPMPLTGPEQAGN
ncbi:MAG TPA: DUF1223 domain-containing protein [Alphaproteobacteria bacterium]|jgi:hypothetical protein